MKYDQNISTYQIGLISVKQFGLLLPCTDITKLTSLYYRGPQNEHINTKLDADVLTDHIFHRPPNRVALRVDGRRRETDLPPPPRLERAGQNCVAGERSCSTAAIPPGRVRPARLQNHTIPP